MPIIAAIANAPPAAPPAMAPTGTPSSDFFAAADGPEVLVVVADPVA